MTCLQEGLAPSQVSGMPALGLHQEGWTRANVEWCWVVQNHYQPLTNCGCPPPSTLSRRVKQIFLCFSCSSNN